MALVHLGDESCVAYVVFWPAFASPFGIMKMLDSNPLGRNEVEPSIWPLPDCVNAPSPVSVAALMMN